MYDDLDLGNPLDFDDLELPPPEGEDDEDVSEDPTEIAGTDELLAAVTARVQASASIGEVELDLEPEPTLANQGQVAPAPAPAASAATPTVAASAPSPEGGSTMALVGTVMLVSVCFAAAVGLLLLAG